MQSKRQRQHPCDATNCENHVPVIARRLDMTRDAPLTLASCTVAMSQVQVKREPFDPALQGETAQPGNGLIYSTFAASINFFRPYAPQIVPILVCAFFVPVVLALSGFAGWVVWNSLSTGWEIPLYLQYGYVVF